MLELQNTLHIIQTCNVLLHNEMKIFWMNWVKQHVILIGIYLSWKLFKDVYEKTEPHTCGWSGKVEEGDRCRGRDWGWEVWAHTATSSRGTVGTAGPGRAGGGAAGLLPQLRNTHSPDRHRILSMSGSFLYTRCGRNPGKEVEVKGASVTSPGLVLTLWTARLSSGCLPAFGVAAVHTQAQKIPPGSGAVSVRRASSAPFVSEGV